MKLAIVIPRYGPKIVGGAESFARQLAEHLPTSEYDVEVLSTCAHDLTTGQNVYPAGLTYINGVRVRRFLIDTRFRDVARFHAINRKLSMQVPLDVAEQYAWIDNNIHSPALYSYLVRYGEQFDLLLFIPYLYGITYYGSVLHPQKTVLWPCLHDEAFAYFLETRLMLTACRGVMLNSEPELQLLREQLKLLVSRPAIVGGGIEIPVVNTQRFRRKWKIRDPFLLYAGRLTAAKNVDTLIAYFIRYKQKHPGPLKLVLMGEGDLPLPRHSDILSIGFQSEEDKHDVYAAATALLQPSLMESFSIVIMESWAVGVPVLVHGDCEVTRHHVTHSNGGLYYTNFAEFTGVLDWLLTHPTERAAMGQLGRSYVLQKYNWAAVLARFREAVALWTT